MTGDDYREKYVAFIDMLGFSQMVRDTADDVERRNEIIDAIQRLRSAACNNPRTGLIVTYFSDCLVISSNRTCLGLLDILQSIVIVAENLLQIDILVRGGLTAGNIHHDGDLMFGPGMLEAYDLERCYAKHPTIIVGDVVKSDILAAHPQITGWLVHDSDEQDRHYIHYLREFAQYDPTPRNGLHVLEGPARLVRHYIARRLNGEAGPVRDKAVWLRKYWNETVGTGGVLGCVDEKADLERPDVQPYRSARYIVGPATSQIAPEAGATGTSAGTESA